MGIWTSTDLQVNYVKLMFDMRYERSIKSLMDINYTHIHKSTRECKYPGFDVFSGD